MSETRSWRGRGRRGGLYELEPYAARAEAVIETLGADGTQVRTGDGRAQAAGAHSAAGWGFASRVVGGLGSVGCFGGEDDLPGSRASPCDTNALAPHVLFCVATVDPGSWLRWDQPGGPLPGRIPATFTRADSFHGQRKGDSDFFGDRSWPEEDAALPVPRARSSTPCLGGWCPPPSQPWPHWALGPRLPLRASRSLGGSGGLKSLGRAEQSDFLQFCPWKVSPVTPPAASLPANIFPGVVVPGWVGGPGQGWRAPTRL